MSAAGGRPGAAAPGAGGAFPFASVAVVGLGLMGGSLARALSDLTEGPTVLGATPDAADLTAAREAGAVHEASPDPDDVVARADWVVYAAPPRATLALLEGHAGRWREGALVTDLTSLKAPVAERVAASGAGARWVGAHPMAGSEAAGFRASRPDLYRGARVWLVSTAAPAEARDRVRQAWAALGARPAWTAADAHDRLMARASHLPQLAAVALAATLEAGGVAHEALGPGGRDATRLAGSPAALWRELLGMAPGEAALALRELEARIADVAGRLEDGDVEGVAALMERTRAWRAGGTPS